MRRRDFLGGADVGCYGRNDVRIDEIGYMTDLLGRHAANEVTRMAAARARKQRFFQH